MLRDPDGLGFLVDLAIVLIVICQALRIDRPAEIRKKQRPIALVAPVTFILLKLERELIKDRQQYRSRSTLAVADIPRLRQLRLPDAGGLLVRLRGDHQHLPALHGDAAAADLLHDVGCLRLLPELVQLVNDRENRDFAGDDRRIEGLYIQLRLGLAASDAFEVILHLEDGIEPGIQPDHPLRLIEAALGDVLAWRDDEHLLARHVLHVERRQAERGNVGRLGVFLRDHAQQLPHEAPLGHRVLAGEEGTEDVTEPITAGLRQPRIARDIRQAQAIEEGKRLCCPRLVQRHGWHRGPSGLNLVPPIGAGKPRQRLSGPHFARPPPAPAPP